jgi:glycosyltransferase involved in cell wall biosynthesis
MKINFYFSSGELTGGYLYDEQVFNALKRADFNILKYNVFTIYKGRGQSYIDGFYSKLISYSRSEDIDIFDYTKSFWCTRRSKAERIIIFHHYDSTENGKQRKYELNFNRFLKNAQNATIVVVSEYWREKLLGYGLKDIQVIYNSFDRDKYQYFLPIDEFRKKFSLPDIPILYLGKNSIAKTLFAYNQLKSLGNDYLLITSGPRKEFDGPIFLKLTPLDYISLLHHSVACILFTDFVEGWSRIAHESILCGTPVIGNGSGGMKELLQQTNQIIMEELNIEKLKRSVDEIYKNCRRVEENDIKKIEKYDQKYFTQAWWNLVKEKTTKKII